MIKQLSEAFGISGLEDNVRSIITDKLNGVCDNIIVDPMGNLIAVTSENKSHPTVILSAHMDEPGFIITDITENGYLKFDTIGSLDVSTLISQRVKINEIIGIIALKAIHLSTKEEREKPIKVRNLFIDIGATSRKEAEKFVYIGDYCYFDTSCKEVGESYIKGKALGGRAGCSILIDLLKRSDEFNVNLVGVFTVQREISSRGAIVASRRLPSADLMIVVDSCEAANHKMSNIKSGEGVAVDFFASENDKVKQQFCTIASEEGIPYRKVVASCRTDASSFAENKTNTPIVLLDIPCKYKNTGINLINKSDIKSVSDLIEAALRRIESGAFLQN